LRKLKFMSFAVLVLLALPIVLNSPIVAADGGDDDGAGENDLLYLGRDPTTLGDWIEQGYGQCGYALPYGYPHQREVAIGITTGIGDSAHRYWWREPWSVEGPESYPYLDYLGGFNILEYEVIGPEGAPRALVDANSMVYRPTWYFHATSIIITLLDVPAGKYRVSLYFLDWDTGYRRLGVKVASGGKWASALWEKTFPQNFAAGIYAIFEVEVTSSITIEVKRLNGKSAVISGVFLDTISSDVSGVNFIGFDRGTKGNWQPLYGKTKYLLAGFNVPLSGTIYKPIDKSYDETNFDPDDYQVSNNGVGQYAADNARNYGEYPYIGQYAAYAWTRMNSETASDPRVLVYPVDNPDYGYPPDPLNGKIYGQWDSGELGWPLNYFIIELMIPEGKFVLSIYAMDFARSGRSETIEIWDEPMTDLLDSQYITSDEINNGIYVQWFVEGPRTINLKAIADPGKVNSFIDGIFLNCLGCPYDGKTKGFWKTNIWKAYQGCTLGTQVSREDILEALNTIRELYGRGSVWGFEWLTFEGSDNSKLQQAYAILNYVGSKMYLKAQAQILALLLTDTHYGNHFAPVWIDWYDNAGGHARTITGWITIILNEYRAGNYETAKNLGDYLNNK